MTDLFTTPTAPWRLALLAAGWEHTPHSPYPWRTPEGVRYSDVEAELAAGREASNGSGELT